MGRKTPVWTNQIGPGMTLEQALKSYDRALIAAERADRTRTTYNRYIGRFIAYLEDDGVKEPRAAELSPERVRAFVIWLKQQPPAVVHGRVMTKGPQAIHAHVIALKTFGRFLLEQGVFKSDPLAMVKNPKKPKIDVDPFTRDEIRRFVGSIGDGPLATRNRALVYFMLASGCRAAEVCGLKVKNVDLRGRLARVFGKGSKERTVQFDKVTARYIALWMAERPGTLAEGCMFVGMDGRPLSTSALYRIIRTIGDRAGVDHAHPHRLRHHAATTFLEAYPGHVFQLQTLLGHSGLEQTRRYVKVAEAHTFMNGPSLIETMGLR